MDIVASSTSTTSRSRNAWTRRRCPATKFFSITLMSPKEPLYAASRQRMICLESVVNDLARIGTSAGPTPASREIEQLRDNARRTINKCFPTLVTLLRANGRAREFAALLVDALDPLPIAVPLAEALIAEVEADAGVSVLEARVLAGDRSNPTLYALRQRIRERQVALQITDAALAQTLAPRTGAVA